MTVCHQRWEVGLERRRRIFWGRGLNLQDGVGHRPPTRQPSHLPHTRCLQSPATRQSDRCSQPLFVFDLVSPFRLSPLSSHCAYKHAHFLSFRSSVRSRPYHEMKQTPLCVGAECGSHFFLSLPVRARALPVPHPALLCYDNQRIIGAVAELGFGMVAARALCTRPAARSPVAMWRQPRPCTIFASHLTATAFATL